MKYVKEMQDIGTLVTFVHVPFGVLSTNPMQRFRQVLHHDVEVHFVGMRFPVRIEKIAQRDDVLVAHGPHDLKLTILEPRILEHLLDGKAFVVRATSKHHGPECSLPYGTVHTVTPGRVRLLRLVGHQLASYSTSTPMRHSDVFSLHQHEDCNG